MASLKKLFILGLITTVALSASIQEADAKPPGINKRQHNQKVRIKNGVKGDSLTHKETARLIHGQKKVNRLEQQFKSDGTFTKKERAIVQHKQNQQSAKIYRLKHNNKTQP